MNPPPGVSKKKSTKNLNRSNSRAKVNRNPGSGMSTQNSAVPVEKAEIHSESIQQVQPIDLAPRGSSVVQIRAVRPFSGLSHGTITTKSVGPQTISGIAGTVGTPIISVNRSTPNLTILPARGPGQPVGSPAQGIPTYQIARVGNVRSTNLSGGQQPASITVTPISSSNFGPNIRLAGATVNNGSWIQAGSGTQGAYTPIRATTITVGARAVRPDGKIMHIPQQGSVQHVAQLQMVDNKGSILKPQLTTTPIVNMRGTLHPQGSTNSGTSVALPLAPFTIRTANMTSLPTIQQRPQTSISNTNTATQSLQKVITQPAHGPNLQLINAQKIPHTIQTIAPISRLSTVCLTLSSNANLTPSNTSPVVAVASRQGATNLIMTPSPLGAGSAVSGLPITKVYPVGRDGTPLVDTIFAQPSSITPTGVTVSTVTMSGSSSQVTGVAHGTPHNVVVASAHSSVGCSTPQSQAHHLVQVHGPINVNASNTSVTVGIGLPPPNVASGSIAPSYYVEKNVTVLQQHHQQSRPIALDKRTDSKNIVTGSMILTTQHPHQQAGTVTGGTVTIPLTHGFTHPIPITHQPGAHQLQHAATHTQILTSLTGQTQHIPTSVLTSVSTPSISVTGPGQGSHIGHSGPGVHTHSHVIPTQVISQPTFSVSSSVTGTITTTTVTSLGISTSATMSTLTGTSNSCSTINTVSVPSGSCPSSSSNCNTSAVSTSTPVQSPSQTKSTLSPRPSILRKREVGDSHCVPLRAQRNLALNFSVNNSGAGVSASASASVSAAASASAAAAAAAAAAANKENAGSGVASVDRGLSVSTAGLSILKKEFQPPNEESSWQSCSSNSSSGSTTISTTSETAEIQMQQQQIPGCITSGLVDLTASLHATSNSSGNNNIFQVGNSTSQNGMIRSASAVVQARIHRNSSVKPQCKDLERVKCKEKEDSVSPRKKPRKQQLTTSDLLESTSPEISFYQGKRFKRSELLDPSLFEGFNERLGGEPVVDEPPPPKIVYYIKKPHMSLLQSNKVTGKPRQNHFHRYSEVKSKEERRPTVNDLANQKNVIQKVNGWKLQHLTNQMDQVIELEVNVVTNFNTLLSKLEAKVGPNCADRDLNRIQELLKGNIQRCKVIRDQMSESRSQVIKILEHKPLILEVINKYISKRPIKKRERL